MSTKKFCDVCEYEVKPPPGSSEVKLATVQLYDKTGNEKLSREVCSDCEQWVRRVISCTRLQLERMWVARDKS